MLLSLGVIGGLLGSVSCGAIVDRFGIRFTMTWAAVALALSLAALGFASSPLAFVAALISLGFFDVSADVSMNVAGSRLSARRDVPVMNRLHGLWSVGTLVGGLVATAAATVVSLRVHLLAVAVVLLAAAGYVRRGLPPDDTGAPPTGEEGAPGAGEEAGVGTGGAAGPRRWSAAVVLFGLIGLLAYMVENVPAEWSAIRMADDLAAGATLAGAAYVAVTAGMVTGRLFGDHATGRIGPRRLTRLAVIVSAVGTALATLGPWSVPSVAGFFVAGLGAAVIFPRVYDEAARASDRPGAVLGAMSAGIRVAGFLTPVVVGTLAATAPIAVGGAMALVVVLAAAPMLVVRERATTSLRAAPS